MVILMTTPAELLPFLSVMAVLVTIIGGVVGIVVKLQEAQSRKLEQCYKDVERLQEESSRMRDELRRALAEVDEAHKARRLAVSDAQYWQSEANDHGRGGSIRRINRSEAAQDRDVERDRVQRGEVERGERGGTDDDN